MGQLKPKERSLGAVVSNRVKPSIVSLNTHSALVRIHSPDGLVAAMMIRA